MAFRVYTGVDARDADALRVFRESLEHHASIPIQVIPLKDWELRKEGHYYRSFHCDPHGQMWDDRDGKPFSTAFGYTRFCIPLLEGYGSEWVAWADPDMLWRRDVAELLALAEEDKGLMCVQHDHRPEDAEKMTGLRQRHYPRKNWSSLMLMRPDKCHRLTRYAVNNMDRDSLHGLVWVEDEEIGSLPVEWNWLEGWSDPAIDPAIVHYTRGTPDMKGYEDAAYADEWRAYLAKAAA